MLHAALQNNAAPLRGEIFFGQALSNGRFPRLTASKKDYRSTAYNNYSADLVDLDNEVYTFEVEASTDSEASEQAERIAFEMGIQVSYINIYKA